MMSELKTHVCKMMGPETAIVIQGDPCDHFGCDVDRRRACRLENSIRSWIDASQKGANLRIIVEDMKKTLEG